MKKLPCFSPPVYTACVCRAVPRFRCLLCLRANQAAALLDKLYEMDDVGHDVLADAPESLLVVKSLSRKLVEGGGNAARADSIEQNQN